MEEFEEYFMGLLTGGNNIVGKVIVKFWLYSYQDWVFGLSIKNISFFGRNVSQTRWYVLSPVWQAQIYHFASIKGLISQRMRKADTAPMTFSHPKVTNFCTISLPTNYRSTIYYLLPMLILYWWNNFSLKICISCPYFFGQNLRTVHRIAQFL